METKQDFINGLRRALTGKISPEEIEEHIRYYEEYITAETQMRGSERDVLNMLGNPKLIAMSICAADAAGERSADGQRVGYGESASNRYQEEGFSGFQEGYSDYNESGKREKDSRPFIFRHPKITIALIVAVVILVIILFIALAFSLLKLLWPALVVIVTAVLLVRLITYLQDHI